MNAIILSIGDELLLGQTLDTNSQWLAQQLAAGGCGILGHLTIGDDQPGIERAIAKSMADVDCDALIISGGLGPTDDDLTRQAIAQAIGAELEMRDDWAAQIEEFFRQRGRPMPRRNRIQAMIPRGAKMLWNPHGTAAGIHVQMQLPLPVPRAGGGGEGSALDRAPQLSALSPPPCPPPRVLGGGIARDMHIFAMPGVPKEMKPMFADYVLPVIRATTGGAVILQKALHTFGVGESSIAEKLGDLMDRSRNPTVGTTASQNIVSLRINARFDTFDAAQHAMNQTIEVCREKLGDIIYGEGDETLALAVARLLQGKSTINNPQSTIQTVTTAESCTGGLLAKYLTDVAGSSAYFKQGFVVYSNQAKYERLGVSEQIIGTYGAVSEPVVLAMARNARRLAKSDYALSISGVAGPDGGTAAKPVGTVCIALAHLPRPAPGTRKGGDREDEDSAVARTFNFGGDREMIRDRAAKTALAMLRFRLLDRSLPF